MNNNITNWSYDKPTEEGLYLICNGDIEVMENIQVMEVQIIDGELKGIFDGDTFCRVAGIGAAFKYAKLCFGVEAKG